ncbi:iron ABC transporter permease [Falsarthrobacter nasiphocae]|uniref:Iron complex transport system permease protein n=2 Tax=Falsarthrobacter nasiphocae TaxID=189863 RepID=A0AAE3YHE5_9MICC|nr:iron ABC transporter permease [Falsarthrobacter nasiphocae]MDR6892250.1 iron complex transport system permease protein [Falsarthrobacter nasiphocae]
MTAWGAGVILLALLAISILLSLAVGARSVPLGDVWRGLTADDGSFEAAVVSARVPRTVLAACAGAALGLAGTGMQGLTRNPLADPGILGVNSGAALAVVVGIFAFGVSGLVGTMAAALIGAAAASLLVFLIAEFGPSNGSAVNLAIAGAAVGAACSAVIGAILLNSQVTLDVFRRWQIGSVATNSFESFVPVLPLLLAGAALLLTNAGALNAIALGEDVARGLGVSLGRARWTVGGGFVLLAAGATAVAGPIGFVGLAVPHMLRLLLGGDHRRIMPLSLLGGAVLVLAADVLGRVVAPPSEVAAGVLTAVVGAPVLVWLAASKKGAMTQ